MLNGIIEKGILPRCEMPTIKPTPGSSLPDLVYLTSVYGPKYAINRAKFDNDDAAAIIRIDTSKLDHSLFLPDDKFLFDTIALTQGSNIDSELVQFSINRGIKERAEYAPASLQRQGIIAYFGSVPVEAIEVIAIYSFEKNRDMTALFSSQPVALGDHDTNRERYAAGTRWIFDATITVQEFMAINPVNYAQLENNPTLRAQVKAEEENLADQIATRPIKYYTTAD